MIVKIRSPKCKVTYIFIEFLPVYSTLTLYCIGFQANYLFLTKGAPVGQIFFLQFFHAVKINLKKLTL